MRCLLVGDIGVGPWFSMCSRSSSGDWSPARDGRDAEGLRAHGDESARLDQREDPAAEGSQSSQQPRRHPGADGELQAVPHRRETTEVRAAVLCYMRILPMRLLFVIREPTGPPRCSVKGNLSKVADWSL